MRLTTKGRYAVTAMMDLAIHQSKRPVTLQDIATGQEISLSYLEQLFAKLRRHGLVKGTRGPGGGYRLAKPADEISIAAIILTLAEVIEPRVEELFLLAQAELRRSGFEELVGTGIVLTGGSSKVEGMVELAEEVFHMPVRLGVPHYVGGLSEVVRNPIYSTGVGLVQFGHKHAGASGKKSSDLSRSKGLVQRMKDWFKRNF
jgi:Rrf2 family protein